MDMTLEQEQLLDLDKLRDKDIQKLKDLEDELYSSVIQAQFEDPNKATPEQKKDFTNKRIKLSNLINDFDTIRIEKIARKLKENELELKKAIDELSATLGSIFSSISTLNQISTLISTITNILVII
jgi:ectoine hydroxylase-related dioxygenase (phytanoyl-CoA dioxygenase family)